MPAEDLQPQTPGDAPTDALADQAGGPDDPNAARIAELEGMVAQQAAMISQLSAQLQAVETVPRPAPTAAKRVVGTEWQGRTSGEWMTLFESGAVARPNEAILCRDGWLAAPGR